MVTPAKYSFVTEWHLSAPLPQVWSCISKPLAWPQWWKGVEAVKELKKGREDEIGSIYSYTFKSRLPYHLRFNLELTQRVEHQLLKGRASGDLEGWGTTLFKSTPRGTLVRYEWEVSTTKPWMNRFSFLLRPVFIYNHQAVMRWGAESLARRLGCKLAGG